MVKNKRIRALDDAALNAVTGGVDSSAAEEIPLSSLDPTELQYFLMLKCPKCKKGDLSPADYRCNKCLAKYRQDL